MPIMKEHKLFKGVDERIVGFSYYPHSLRFRWQEAENNDGWLYSVKESYPRFCTTQNYEYPEVRQFFKCYWRLFGSKDIRSLNLNKYSLHLNRRGKILIKKNFDEHNLDEHFSNNDNERT